MNRKRQIVTTAVFLGFSMSIQPGSAAEFEDSDVIPETSSVVFLRHSIGLTVEPQGVVDRTTHYFVSSRDDHEFNRVSRQEFSNLLEDDHYHSQFGAYHHSGVYLGHQNQLSKRDIVVSDGDCDYHEIVSRSFERDDLNMSVQLKCSSWVVDALVVGGEIWIATMQQGDHGEYGGEELLIASLADGCVNRVNTGGFPHYGLAQDPWSKDVWVVSQDRITVVTDRHAIRRQYWPIHKFDEINERPDLFAVASKKPLKSDPLAILAYDLGESNYQPFYQAAKDLTERPDDQVLYEWNMGGPKPAYYPRLPKELNVLVSHAEPSYAWLKFVCMLDDERAKQLCSLDLDNWP